MAKIGLMGGTFDPIHYGHLLLAEFARTECCLDEIWFLPTGHSYMKANQKQTDAMLRKKMVEIAISGHSDVMKCCDLEVKRQGNTYTYETLEELHLLYPQHDFYFIFGADCLFDIDKWKCPERIFSLCTIIAAVRNDCDIHQMECKIQELKEAFGGNIELLPFLRIEISSTMIRNRVHNGNSIHFMISDNVIDFIEEKGLYR